MSSIGLRKTVAVSDLLGDPKSEQSTGGIWDMVDVLADVGIVNCQLKEVSYNSFYSSYRQSVVRGNQTV